MFKSYFTIAIRQMLKQKIYSVIKIGGFALSIAACLLIALYIRDELSYDRDNPHADRVFRLVNEYNNNGKMKMGAYYPAPLAAALQKDYPEVERSGRLLTAPLFYGAGSNLVKKEAGGQSVYEEGFAYADPEVPGILDMPMVSGDRDHALDRPNTLVLTKSKAEKFFPGENPVGKTLFLNNHMDQPYTIGGVMADHPHNTHFQFDYLLTLKGRELWPGEQTNWLPFNYHVYVQLRPGIDAKAFEARLDGINTHYLIPQFEAGGYKDAVKMIRSNVFHIEPLQAIHLSADEDGLAHGDIRFVWLFGTIAFFILFIACINFVNLATAKSASRAREVGLRKVIGSGRIDLVRQFLAESLVFSLVSFVLGFLLAWLLLPWFNGLAGKALVFPWTAWWLLPILLLAAIVVGILAGIYPAFYLSAFKPIQVLKGQLSKGTRGAGLRGILVVFQFTTSIVLIIGTLIIYSQMQYILHKKTGFDKEQVMLIQGTHTLGKEIGTFKNELKALPMVKNASIGDYLPIAGTKRDMNNFWREGRMNLDGFVGAQSWVVDEDYLGTMGMQLAAGRNFSRTIALDSQAVILNQTMADKLHLGKEPLGKRISNGGGTLTSPSAIASSTRALSICMPTCNERPAFLPASPYWPS